MRLKYWIIYIDVGRIMYDLFLVGILSLIFIFYWKVICKMKIDGIDDMKRKV